MEPRAGRDLLEASGKALALAAVLLPVAGAALRFIAFEAGGPLTVSSYQLAWTAPIQQLAATGLAGLYSYVLVLGLIALIIWSSRGRRDYLGRLIDKPLQAGGMWPLLLMVALLPLLFGAVVIL